MRTQKSFIFGPMPNVKFPSDKLTMQPNDTIFLYTDGITEAINPEEEMYSEEKLKQVLSQLKNKTVMDIAQGVQESIKEFVEEAPQWDDLTLLILRYKGQE